MYVCVCGGGGYTPVYTPVFSGPLHLPAWPGHTPRPPGYGLFFISAQKTGYLLCILFYFIKRWTPNPLTT